MNFLIISCKKDLASINLEKRLFEKYKLKDNKIITNGKNNIYFKKIDELHIYSKEQLILENTKDIDQIIFLSRHSTVTEFKPKCMTVHAIGNWGKAELGGKDYTLVKTDPILIRSLLYSLKKNKPKEIKPYEIKQEATHHGPFINISTIFYEIGSKESDWKREDVASYMIDILINTIKDYDKEKIKKEKQWIEAVGIGGSHYCSKFNKKTFKQSNKFAFGHIAANYTLKDIEKKPEILEQAKKKSNSNKIIYEKDL
jgi:D-aminoacyl-tRNA deacylase